MSKKIDWLYHRKSCITCQRAEKYRDDTKIDVKETVIANKTRFESAAALGIARKVKKLVSMKGKSSKTLNITDDTPDDDILALIMGPTGNLRAPTAIVGKTMIVGFNPEVYAELLG